MISFALKSALSEINITTQLLCLWNISFFPHFYIQHIYGLLFETLSIGICIIGIFGPFTLNAIKNILRIKSNILFLFSVYFPFFFLFPSFLPSCVLQKCQCFRIPFDLFTAFCITFTVVDVGITLYLHNYHSLLLTFYQLKQGIET